MIPHISNSISPNKQKIFYNLYNLFILFILIIIFVPLAHSETRILEPAYLTTRILDRFQPVDGVPSGYEPYRNLQLLVAIGYGGFDEDINIELPLPQVVTDLCKFSEPLISSHMSNLRTHLLADDNSWVPRRFQSSRALAIGLWMQAGGEDDVLMLHENIQIPKSNFKVIGAIKKLQTPQLSFSGLQEALIKNHTVVLAEVQLPGNINAMVPRTLHCTTDGEMMK